MISLKKLYTHYDKTMKLCGFERSAFRLVHALDLFDDNCEKILDVGCGPGTIGLALLARFPGAYLVTTDNDTRFFPKLLSNAKEYNIDIKRITIGKSDVISPEKITLSDNTTRVLHENEFDIVSASGVIGYSEDQEASLRSLLQLVRPGGIFLDVELADNPVGSTISKVFRYPILPRKRILEIIEAEGFFVEVVPMPISCFPINLTRMCIVARKNS